MQMEPMTLGSPPSSPSSPQINPNYLPAFLMGEKQVQTPNRPSNLSPTKGRSFAFKSPSGLSEQRSVQSRLFLQQSADASSFNLSSVGAEKPGPPALGLFDTLESSEYIGSPRVEAVSTPVKDTFDIKSPIMTENRFTSTPTTSNFQRNLSESGPDKSFLCAPNSNIQRNLNDCLSKSHPFRKQKDKSEALWVTVLGFPPHATSLVVSQFAQFGTITEKKFPPEGNWLHLKYSAAHEVARAMSYNGKLITNNIMVGVISHQKPANPTGQSEDKENTEQTPNDKSCGTPVITSPNRARLLTQSYTLPRATEVLSPQNVPQRSTGLVTKAMEYVFGW